MYSHGQEFGMRLPSRLRVYRTILLRTLFWVMKTAYM